MRKVEEKQCSPASQGSVQKNNSDMKVTDADAQLQLGNNYYDNKQYSMAVKCYEMAAKAGNAEAQYYMGLYYDDRLNGVLGEKRESSALYWYKKAAEQYYEDAVVDLGVKYNELKKYDRAYGLFNQAVRKWSNIQACFWVGVMLFKGEGTDKDEEKGLKNIHRAADDANEPYVYACDWLANYYEGKKPPGVSDIAAAALAFLVLGPLWGIVTGVLARLFSGHKDEEKAKYYKERAEKIRKGIL